MLLGGGHNRAARKPVVGDLAHSELLCEHQQHESGHGTEAVSLFLTEAVEELSAGDGERDDLDLLLALLRHRHLAVHLGGHLTETGRKVSQGASPHTRDADNERTC